jgi:alkanesulfonate monooxygenase SsuD/methylene tetrahydromethanopterin reductase-like flavin-dependent oxidoreductase (luciferase family)
VGKEACGVRFGFVLPSGDARTAAGMAQAAEEAGWDGFFVWDPVWGIDPWVALAAAAMQTRRIRLGTMITPLSRQRPWTLAGQTATLDNLSGGRVILAVGLGAVDTGFAEFGEVTERKTRAELLDEGLAIIDGLWRGQPFSFEGKHYHIRPSSFMPPPPPVQRPRIPIWVVGAWRRPRSMGRALRWDGVLPARMDPDGRFEPVTAQDVADIQAYASARRPADAGPFDIVVDGQTPGGDPPRAAAQVRPLAKAGATWWIETLWEAEGSEPVLERIRQGPPKV